MNKNEFMKSLSNKLKRLPQEEKDNALNYYTEYFLDAGIDDETDVVPLIGTPDAVAVNIMDECLDKQIVKVNQEGGVKNNSKAIWYIIIGLLVSPVAVPLCTGLVIAIITLLIAVAVTILSLLLSAVVVVISGVAMLPFVFWAGSVPQVLILLGYSLICISGGIFMFFGFLKLGELIVRGIVKLFSYIGKKIIVHQVAKGGTEA